MPESVILLTCTGCITTVSGITAFIPPIYSASWMEELIMIAPELLKDLFCDSYEKVLQHTDEISHAESVKAPGWGGNPMHWTLGHIVVARCNFLRLLDVPSIWDWSTCKRFIPGSAPAAETAEAIDFAVLRTDLTRTQEQLLEALVGLTLSDMETLTDDGTVGEHLAEYAAHEAYHAGQLEILRQWLGKG